VGIAPEKRRDEANKLKGESKGIRRKINKIVNMTRNGERALVAD